MKYSKRGSPEKYDGDGASRSVSASAICVWNFTASAPHSAASATSLRALPKEPS